MKVAICGKANIAEQVTQALANSNIEIKFCVEELTDYPQGGGIEIHQIF